MKHRITFQQLTVTTNENGFEVKAWQDYKTVWAKATSLSGREYYQAAAVQAEKTMVFLIRYIEGIDESLKIKFEDKKFSITYIDALKYQKKYIEIKAMEVIKSG
ncbi:MAG: phage head closure protein [Bacteroidales bacterium]